jgi:hypothetical protein
VIGYMATQVITNLAGAVAMYLAPSGVLDNTQSGRPAQLSAADLVLPGVVIGLAAVTAAIIRAPLTPLTLGLLYIDRRIRLENLHASLAMAAGSTEPLRSSPAE